MQKARLSKLQPCSATLCFAEVSLVVIEVNIQVNYRRSIINVEVFV